MHKGVIGKHQYDVRIGQVLDHDFQMVNTTLYFRVILTHNSVELYNPCAQWANSVDYQTHVLSTILPSFSADEVAKSMRLLRSSTIHGVLLESLYHIVHSLVSKIGTDMGTG